MPSGKTIRSGESAGISSALKTTDMATLMAAFGDAKSPTLNSGTRCMSGPVFAIRVPPRLQEVIPPYYKRRKIERPTRKKSSAQGRNASAHDRRGQRVCVGPDRDHDERWSCPLHRTVRSWVIVFFSNFRFVRLGHRHLRNASGGNQAEF